MVSMLPRPFFLTGNCSVDSIKTLERLEKNYFIGYFKCIQDAFFSFITRSAWL